MKIRIVAFILASFTPALACLVYAWRAYLVDRTQSGSAGWRAGILTIAVWLATTWATTIDRNPAPHDLLLG